MTVVEAGFSQPEPGARVGSLSKSARSASVSSTKRAATEPEALTDVEGEAARLGIALLRALVGVVGRKHVIAHVAIGLAVALEVREGIGVPGWSGGAAGGRAER